MNEASQSGIDKTAPAPLATRIAEIPACADPQALEVARQRLDEAFQADPAAATAWSELTVANEAPRHLLDAVFGGSPYLTDLIVRDPARLVGVFAQAPEARFAAARQRLADALRDAEDEADAMRLLRVFKAETALITALCDIAAVWDIAEVTRRIAEAADTAASEAVRFLLRAAVAQGRFLPSDPGDPALGCALMVLAMGKHGAFELNYSSDIDLIVFYDAHRAPLAEGVEPSTFFVRLTRSFVKLLQDRTGEGYVYRVDLRLRPDPGATPIAMSVAAAQQYYESMGQNWERAALIKARPVAGDLTAGEAFLADVAPFVWRKYLDFAAISDIHAMKRQIHAHKGHGAIAVAGHNIKLGRGGIREIEFFVQTQQLIAGGRQPELRGRRTLTMLARLAELGWITEEADSDLAAAYCFLRRVEHRLQMQRDEQTHALPSDPDELARFVLFCGFADVAAFADTLTGHLRKVQSHYAALFEEEPELASDSGNLVFTGGDDDPETLESLQRMGYHSPADVARLVRSWHFGRYPAMRSEKARERLTKLVPPLLAALAQSGNPQAALVAFDAFLARLPAGVQLLSVLRANPEMLRLLAAILGTAPRLAQVLSRRPRVLDAVLDPDFFGGLPDPGSLREHLDVTMELARGYEDLLDRARQFGQEQAFLIGVRILSGVAEAAQAGPAFAALADLLVERLHLAAAAELAGHHGTVPGGGSVVLAMGKLGGREMTAASDLDLQLIYDMPQDSLMSKGGRPLAAGSYFIRLTQRLIAALSAPTGEGTLYEVDMRLRPSGNAGPLATHLVSFADYQTNTAWTWEHMALTRARVICGDAALRAQVEAVIARTLCRPRDRDAIAADVAEMRQRIHREKGSDDPWRLKLVPGGLVDVEFVCQFLQLVHAHRSSEVLQQNTLAGVRKLIDAGALAKEDGETLLGAGTLYHNLTQILRLCLEGEPEAETTPPDLKALLAKAGGQPDFLTLGVVLHDVQEKVREVFERVIGAAPWE